MIIPIYVSIYFRNSVAQKLDETFWNTGFTYEVSTLASSGVSDSKTCSRDGFLVPVLAEITLAGKSVQVLESLGKLSCVISKPKGLNLLISGIVLTYSI